MLLYDFEYDGVKLSDRGYMICSGSNGINTESDGCKINFITVPVNHGLHNEFIASNYTDCVTASFSICKKPCGNQNMYITLKDFNDMAEWLNRRRFHMLKIYDESFGEDICFNASFNLTKQDVNGKIVSIDLEMVTDKPHAFLDKKYIIDNEVMAGEPIYCDSLSNEESCLYPLVELTPFTGGDIYITNTADGDNETIIKNCTASETIALNYPAVTTSNNAHKIYNDFNWVFPRIVTKYNDKQNIFKVNKRCQLKMYYYPIVKIGM